MRVGIDVRSMQTPSAGRGLGRYTYDLVASLLKYAPEHEYVLIKRREVALPELLCQLSQPFEVVETSGPFWHDQRPPLHLRLPRLRNHLGLQRRHCGNIRRQNRNSIAQAVRRARLDVIHFPTAPDLGSFPSGRFECSVVRTFADATCLNMREAYYDVWHAAMRDHYDEQIASMKEADRLTAYSDSSRADAIRLAGVASDKIETVYCAVADDWTPITDIVSVRECFSRFNIQSDYFVFCSPNDPNKNVSRLLEAFAEVLAAEPNRQLKLVLITSTEDENAVPLLKEAWRLGLSKNDLVLTGRVSDDDLKILFGRALALVTPSLYEGFGLPAAQALSLGTPILASQATSLPEVVGEAGLLFDPRSTSAIADSMLQILRDESLRSALAAKAVDQARQFSYERQARQMISVYADAVAVKKHRPALSRHAASEKSSRV